MFKISSSDFRTLGMRRQKRGCADEYLATVTKAVVHGVHKVVTGASFGVILRLKENGGIWTFQHCDARSPTNL